MRKSEARSEIIRLLHYGRQNLSLSAQQQDALEIAIDWLEMKGNENEQNKQPAPDTGLMPCGCGGEAKVWPSDLRQAMVTAYQVGCIECAMTTAWVRGKQENAVKVWNTAMGWKGGAE